MASTRIVLFSLPLVTVVVVGFALLVVGTPRPYIGARIYGGPTDEAPRVALTLSVVERYADYERGYPSEPCVVEALFSDGRRAAQSATPDAQGMASVVLEAGPMPLKGPIDVRVSLRGRAGQVIARGKLALSAIDWNSRARVRGGWLNGARSGELTVRVAPGRGALAVPFADPLWVEVLRGATPVANAKLEIDPDGIDLASQPPFMTDATGRASISVIPREHATSVKVVATTEDGARGEWSGIMPVVPGALHAERDQDKLRIESPIERERAYYALIGERARYAGGAVALAANGRGGSVALVDLDALPSGPIWAVVSSDPELDSATSVGWPLNEPKLSEPTPPLARAVADRLLLDGLEIGRAVDAGRRRSARVIAFGFSALAAVLAGILLAREVRRSSKRLDEHLADAGTEDDDADAITDRPARWVQVVVALVCVAMGFLVVALVSMYRVGSP